MNEEVGEMLYSNEGDTIWDWIFGWLDDEEDDEDED